MLQEEKADSVIIELRQAQDAPLLQTLIQQYTPGKIIDSATLLLDSPKAARLGGLLAELEAKKIDIKQIRYGTTNLESLFLRITSPGSGNV
jgi:ABC-2 type transport system ATP-binding protein